MASITQTIPQYSLGMSEQPDQLKFPGQVTEVTNAIPDVTRGLYKRPGAKRIGTDKLVDVQNGGSWFHYFRDETEGSYIGQVASDGEVRVWRCRDGLKMTTVYGTGGQTAIKNYLKTEISATYYRVGSQVTVNSTGHNMQTGDVVTADFTGGATDGTYTITRHNDDTFKLTDPDSDNSHIPTNDVIYVKKGSHENLQFLTINDTTFVNSRNLDNANTLVGTTGTTDARPHTHFGFVELLRTENGRQYGLNISDASTAVSLTRATRISIESDTLDESDGTGHCPGIGTQVFSVTAANSYAGTNTISVKNGNTDLTSGKDNLIFRINTLGQQGVSPDYSATGDGPDGDNYRCSYNREAVLLHGGEGWVEGDTVTVSLNSASGGGPMRNKWDTAVSYNQNDLVRNKGNTYKAKVAHNGVEPTHTSTADDTTQWEFVSNTDSPAATYTVKVLEHETTQVQAKINNTNTGLIRPAPTPFDSDTAVTADTILGGLKTQIDNISGIDCKIIGTGIYIFSNTQDFNLEVVEEDLMRCFQSSVNDVQNLPNQCKNGYIVKISNSRMSDEDDYYLQFSGEGGDGVGSWNECAEPGIAKTLTNMPLVIQRTATTTFTVRQFTYANRRVGDNNTNPLPSFVGQRINKVLFFRNRLAILSGENVVTSRPGTLDESYGGPDFFAETALTVSASDPVDISAASTFPSELFDGIEVNTGLVVFSTNQQFLLAADDTVFNPDTAKLRSIATFNYNETIPPISLGTTVAYVDNSGKFSRFNEMANIQREGEPNVVEVSKVVPTLLPKDIDLLTNSRENSIILLGKTNSDTVLGYRYFQVSEQRQQAAWFKWKLNNPLIYHFIINDEYFFLDNDYYLQSIKLIQTEDDASIVQDEIDFLLHVDNYTTISSGNFSPTTNITTFSNVDWLNTVTTPNHDLVVIDSDAAASRVGRYVKPIPSTRITVPATAIQNNSITITNHGLTAGDQLVYDSNGGNSITTANTTNIYYAQIVDANTFRLTSNTSGGGGYYTISESGNNNQFFIVNQNEITLKGDWSSTTLTVGYIYPYEVKFPTFYATRQEGRSSQADVNSSLILHRIKFHFGKIGLYETTLERVGKTNYTEVYESTELDEYSASDAPYLEEFIKTVPIYEKNTNVDITLRSSHPAPATLRAVSWEGDYSPKYYKRV